MKFKITLFFAVITATMFFALYELPWSNIIGDAYAKLKPTQKVDNLPEPLTAKERICAATNGENCEIIYELCKRESGQFDLSYEESCQQFAVNKNRNGTFDHSWLQINDLHIIGRPASHGQGTITMACVYDLECVSVWTNKKIKEGDGHIWMTWNKAKRAADFQIATVSKNK